jgi:hypothetical protein
VEHFIITSVPEIEIVHHRAAYNVSKGAVSAIDLPDLLSAAAMADAEVICACDELELAVRKLSADVHRELFCERFALEFNAAPEDFLVQYVLLDVYTEPLKKVFRLTCNEKLREHGRILAQLPKITRDEN